MQQSGSDRTSDILVVGGGLAGLTAATYAARGGRRVTLLEKGGAVGGRATTQQRAGFALNQGAHALYRAGVGMAVVRDLGIATPGGLPAAAGGFALEGGVKHTMPGGFLSLLSTGLLPWRAKLEVARLLATLPRLETAAHDGTSVHDALQTLVSQAETRSLFRALVRLSTYGNDPDRQSAGAALAQLKLAVTQNVIYLDGGWQTLVDGLRLAADRAGVSVRTGAKVERIEPDETGVSVALADGGTLRTGALVLAVAPSEAADMVESRHANPLERWASEEIPMLAACLDVCLSRVPVAGAKFALGIDQPVYLSVHSAVARLAPAGHGLIHLLKYLGSRASEDPSADEGELEATLDLVQPGWRSAVVHRRFLPKMVVSHGLVTAARGGLAGRPGPAVPGEPRLFVAGDWVGPEGLLADASLDSGRRAGELAARAPTLVARAA